MTYSPATGDTLTSLFIAATGISDATIEAALVDLESVITSIGVSKFYALYPFCGGTATTHKYNFMDAQDTDAAFRIDWYGGVTHDADGATGNGSTGYGDTHLASSSVLSKDDKGLTISHIGTSAGAIGNNTINNSSFDGIFANTTAYLYLSDLNNVNESLTGGSSNILSICRANSSEINAYKAGAAWGTNPKTNASTASQNTSNIEVLRANAQYFNGGLNFAAIHKNLSSTEVSDLHTAIADFNTALSR
jgi:hypothetical protein